MCSAWVMLIRCEQERLAKNIPRTLDNTRIFDSTSYLTANPGTLRIAAERVAEASRAINGEAGPSQPRDEVPVNAEEVDDEDEVMPDAQALTAATSADVAAVPKDAPLDAEREVTGEAVEEEEEEADLPPPAPPRILVTTSPSPCKETYQFCDDLRSIFPGGQFFKRPKGRGFELGRVARWAAKRGFAAVIAVNQDHKTPSECFDGGGSTSS